MTKFVEFLVNNYIWFLVGAIVLIFALIGYLVDTKNKKRIANGEIIIKPKIKEKKIKTKEDLTKESLSEMEDVTLGDAMKPKNKKKEEMPKEEVKPVPEAPYDTPIIKEPEVSEDSFEVDDK
jgi:hypothetical protein